ncbi:hypothetical protein [Thiohalophilus sp.]|uniref:hypothetical protein n=1 Tax=Thiohalophilus sp. TaxID=3028392 RepID=UPI003974A1C6
MSDGFGACAGLLIDGQIRILHHSTVAHHAGLSGIVVGTVVIIAWMVILLCYSLKTEAGNNYNIAET